MSKWKDDPAYALDKAFEEDVKELIESIRSSGLKLPPLIIKEKRAKFRATYRLVDALR